MADADDLMFRTATTDDVEAVVDAVNAAYRGDSSRAGWTTEADLLVGARTDATEIASIIARDDAIILLCERDGGLVGSVHLRREDERVAYLGMLVVSPGLQTAGIGKRLLARAEDEVRARWGSDAMVMTVISLRAELIAFYERRGYRRTGRTEPFPAVSLSEPQVPDLAFEVLEKSLSGGGEAR